MTKELKQELFKYCESKYKRAVEDHRYHRQTLFSNKYRPKNKKGDDIIELCQSEIDKYRQGMIELSEVDINTTPGRSK